VKYLNPNGNAVFPKIISKDRMKYETGLLLNPIRLSFVNVNPELVKELIVRKVALSIVLYPLNSKELCLPVCNSDGINNTHPNNITLRLIIDRD
jgi:hypothetical protein